ncbi:MAG: GIY-YIG nuclease family protein [Sulfurovum sp.]|nr:GIY-YIG nuclease family protein [Sulfurovum sp.]
MATIGTLTLTGLSGNKYKFNVYSFDTTFKELGAIYYISKRTTDSNGKGTHSKIYIGMTGDLSTRFNNHHKEDCFNKKNANCKSILIEENKETRLEIEADLIESLNPPCNGDI